MVYLIWEHSFISGIINVPKAASILTGLDSKEQQICSYLDVVKQMNNKPVIMNSHTTFGDCYLVWESWYFWNPSTNLNSCHFIVEII